MSLYKQFETNEEIERQGIWIEYGDNEDGTTPGFKLSRMAKTNKKYTKAFERACRPHKKAIELETLDESLAEKVFMGVFFDTILLDWRNVKDLEGNDLPLTKENAFWLFNKLPELYDDLQENARKAALFRKDDLETDSGN